MGEILLQFVVPGGLMVLTYFFGRTKSNADVKKTQAETELIYSQKYATDIEATNSFRELLISENKSLKDELTEVKKELSELKTAFNELKNLMCKNAKTCKNKSI